MSLPLPDCYYSLNTSSHCKAGRSADVECAICLERVLGTRGRKFGLLESCDHAFCLACIRSWRATADSGAAGDTVRRSCAAVTQTLVFKSRFHVLPLHCR